MRDNNLEIVHIRDVYDQSATATFTVSGGGLDNAAYAADDYLHQPIITFSNVFLEQTDCYAELVSLTFRETNTAGTLQKPALKVYIFDTCDITPTCNGDFDFADGTNTTLANIIGVVTVAGADYTTVKSGGADRNAIAVAEPTKPLIVKVGSSNRNIPALALTTGTPTFDNSTSFSITATFRLL